MAVLIMTCIALQSQTGKPHGTVAQMKMESSSDRLQKDWFIARLEWSSVWSESSLPDTTGMLDTMQACELQHPDVQIISSGLGWVDWSHPPRCLRMDHALLAFHRYLGQWLQPNGSSILQ